MSRKFSPMNKELCCPVVLTNISLLWRGESDLVNRRTKVLSWSYVKGLRFLFHRSEFTFVDITIDYAPSMTFRCMWHQLYGNTKQRTGQEMYLILEFRICQSRKVTWCHCCCMNPIDIGLQQASKLENKTIFTPPLPLNSKIGNFLVSTGSSNTERDNMNGGGRGGKAVFSSFLSWQKVQGAHLGQSVSTIADCRCETFGKLTRTFETFIKQKVKLFFGLIAIDRLRAYQYRSQAASTSLLFQSFFGNQL